MSQGERRIPRIALTMGDPAGVGPEVILRSLVARSRDRSADIVVVGSESAMSRWRELLAIGPRVDVVDVGDAPVEPGCPTPEGARAALESIETAVRMCRAGQADAMVTGPVSKAAIASLGVDFRGHTEYLARITGAPECVMTFVSGSTRIALATTHIAIAEVPGAITRELLVSKLRTLDAGLRTWLGVDRPRIAVCALNPHSGEGGKIGGEEAEVIAPAVAEAAGQGVDVRGPYPADSLFARSPGSRAAEPGSGSAEPNHDAVLAMYHDQGTIAAKMLAGGEGVNLTLGLPIIRTSVDHGTAFDLAGHGRADHRSMAAAIRLASDIALAVRA